MIILKVVTRIVLMTAMGLLLVTAAILRAAVGR